jgi:hypothetical protein
MTSDDRNIPCPYCSQETRLNCEMCAGTGRHIENRTFVFLVLAVACGSVAVWLLMRVLHRWAL